MANYPLTGLPSDFRAPIQAGEVAFGQGASAAPSPTWDIVFVMPKTSAGSWTANQRYQSRTEGEVRDGAGVGSFLHRAAKKLFETNRNVTAWFVPYLASSGGSPVAAAGTVTFTNAPTGTGVATLRILSRIFRVVFRVTDTVTTIAAAFKALINGATELPCTADNSSGILTITAKHMGASSGDGTTGVIWYEAEIEAGKGTTVATSGAALGLGSGTAGADGSTAEVTNFTAALATLESVRHYFVVTSLWTEAALDALVSHIANKSEAKRGLRSVGIAGHGGTQAAGTALALSQNYERLRIVQMYHADHDPAELAANAASVLQKQYTLYPGYCFDFYSEVDWAIKPVRNAAYRPDIDDLNDGINDGLFMIASNETTSYVAMDCTTRSKNSAGTVDDFRATEGHRVSVGDALMDNILADAPADFSKKNLKADKLLKDGSIDYNATYGSRTITPSMARGFFGRIAERHEQRDNIQSAQYMMDSLYTGIDPENNGRLECKFDFMAVNHLHQFTVRAAETTPG